jgi:hypothetical protein
MISSSSRFCVIWTEMMWLGLTLTVKLASCVCVWRRHGRMEGAANKETAHHRVAALVGEDELAEDLQLLG